MLWASSFVHVASDFVIFIKESKFGIQTVQAVVYTNKFIGVRIVSIRKCLFSGKLKSLIVTKIFIKNPFAVWNPF